MTDDVCPVSTHKCTKSPWIWAFSWGIYGRRLFEHGHWYSDAYVNGTFCKTIRDSFENLVPYAAENLPFNFYRTLYVMLCSGVTFLAYCTYLSKQIICQNWNIREIEIEIHVCSKTESVIWFRCLQDVAIAVDRRDTGHHQTIFLGEFMKFKGDSEPKNLLMYSQNKTKTVQSCGLTDPCHLFPVLMIDQIDSVTEIFVESPPGCHHVCDCPKKWGSLCTRQLL